MCTREFISKQGGYPHDTADDRFAPTGEHTLLTLFAVHPNLTRNPMSAAVVIGLIVIAIVAGTAISLRSTARTGMPSKEVLDRAKQRSRELEAAEKAEQPERSD
jgi:hypothetical protein